MNQRLYLMVIMVLVVVVFTLMCIISTKTPANTIDQSALIRLPVGSSIIGVYCNTSTLDGHCFTKWQFMGECFMSSNIGNPSAVLTKINCPQSDSTKSTKDSK